MSSISKQKYQSTLLSRSWIHLASIWCCGREARQCPAFLNRNIKARYFQGAGYTKQVSGGEIQWGKVDIKKFLESSMEDFVHIEKI